MPPGGLEPPTVGLKVRCSAIELEGQRDRVYKMRVAFRRCFCGGVANANPLPDIHWFSNIHCLQHTRKDKKLQERKVIGMPPRH